MTFRKPAGMKYTDMCIYIDAHSEELAKAEKPNNELVNNVYKYLYLIIYALSCKKRYFRDDIDYENYALSAAAIIYMRLVDKRQYLPDDDPRKIKPIKSVLNYINASMYGLKVNYQQESFFPGVHPNILAEENNRWSSTDLSTVGEDQYIYAMRDTILEELEYLPNKVNRVLKTTPYRNDPIMYKNLYISLMLSFIDLMTLPTKIIKSRKKKQALDEKLVLSIYREKQENKPILYRLPETMSDYVKVLLNRVKKEFAQILIDTQQSYVFPEETISDIVASIYTENTAGGNTHDN